LVYLDAGSEPQNKSRSPELPISTFKWVCVLGNENDQSGVAAKFGNFTNTANIFLTIIVAKPQILAQTMTYIVAV